MTTALAHSRLLSFFCLFLASAGSETEKYGLKKFVSFSRKGGGGGDGRRGEGEGEGEMGGAEGAWGHKKWTQ